MSTKQARRLPDTEDAFENENRFGRAPPDGQIVAGETIPGATTTVPGVHERRTADETSAKS